MIETTLQDIQHGLRLLRREPGFAAVAILTLALGTGVSAALFSVIDSALLHPLPYPHPEQLIDVGVEERRGNKVLRGLAPSLEDVRAWNAANAGFTHVAIKRTLFPDAIFDAGAPERVESIKVSEEYFALFGVTLRLGRAFNAADVVPGAPGVLLISDRFWHSRFGADPGVVGRVVRIDGVPATIIGVLPRGFGGTMPLWRPLQVEVNRVQDRGSGWLVYGRLTDPTPVSSVAARLTAVLPGANDAANGSSASVRFMMDNAISTYRTTVTILTSAVSVILLLACVNVGGLLLARGTARHAELAIRAAMGASRGRLIRQMLTESLVLSAIGGLAGIGLAWLTLDAVVANLAVRLPDDAPARINLVVLLGSVVVITLTGLLFGLIPALRLSRVRLGQALARSGRQHAASLSRRGGQSLIAIEIALALVMLAGAGLMLRSFSRLVSVDLGFDPTRIMILQSQPIDPRHPVYASYYPALVSAIRQLPGVEAVGAGDSGPLGGMTRFSLVGKPGGQPLNAVGRTVLPGYIEALGIPLVAGRLLADADMNLGPGAVVINQSAARQWFADASPVGQGLEINKVPAEVVGVVGDIRNDGPQGQVRPEIYLPYRPDLAAKTPPNALMVVVRPRGASPGLAGELRRIAATIGPSVVIDGVRPGRDLFGETVDRPRQRTVLLTLLGALGLTLALVGVLGITSHAVGRRTQEIGVRLALGAQPGQVVRAMLRDSAAPILVGLVVGTAAALLTTKVIKSFLFETSPTDPITLGLVAVALGLVGCVAAWIPARRAAHVDPLTTLRSE